MATTEGRKSKKDSAETSEEDEFMNGNGAADAEDHTEEAPVAKMELTLEDEGMVTTPDPEGFMGKIVKRSFGRKASFLGRVVGWFPPEGDEEVLWHVKHPDGDEEDLDKQECIDGIAGAEQDAQYLREGDAALASTLKQRLPAAKTFCFFIVSSGRSGNVTTLHQELFGSIPDSTNLSITCGCPPFLAPVHP